MFTSEVGRCYTHHPIRVWDAMIVLSLGEEVTSIKPETIDSFLLSINTNDTAPSFTAVVPPSSAFTVESVYAKREYSRGTGAGRLVVTEVQHLCLHSLNTAHANLQAMCLPRNVMIAENRLWWEARVDVQDVSRLQDAIRLVECLDNVGYGNTGPWFFDRSVVGEENVVPVVPFW